MDYKDYLQESRSGANRLPRRHPRRPTASWRGELHPDKNSGNKKAEARVQGSDEANRGPRGPKKERQQYDMLRLQLGLSVSRGPVVGPGAAAPQGARDPFGGSDRFGPGGPFAAYGGPDRGATSATSSLHRLDTSRTSSAMFFGGAQPGKAARRRHARRRPAASAKWRHRDRPARGRRRRPRGRQGLARRGRPSQPPARRSLLAAPLRRRQAARARPRTRGRTTPRSRGTRRGEDVEVEWTCAGGGIPRFGAPRPGGDRRLEVKGPAGVETGSKIRLSGKAGSGRTRGPLPHYKGQAHPVFTRTARISPASLPITLVRRSSAARWKWTPSAAASCSRSRRQPAGPIVQC